MKITITHQTILTLDSAKEEEMCKELGVTDRAKLAVAVAASFHGEFSEMVEDGLEMKLVNVEVED